MEKIRLFEKTKDGLLVEVQQEARVGRRFSRVITPIDVLWTEEEEQQRNAEEAAAEDLSRAREEAERNRPSETVEQKLAKVGLTIADLKQALGEPQDKLIKPSS